MVSRCRDAYASGERFELCYQDLVDDEKASHLSWRDRGRFRKTSNRAPRKLRSHEGASWPCAGGASRRCAVHFIASFFLRGQIIAKTKKNCHMLR